KVADAVLEGKAIREAQEAEVEEAEAAGEEDITRYLGPSTLAKLKATEEVEASAEIDGEGQEEVAYVADDFKDDEDEDEADEVELEEVGETEDSSEDVGDRAEASV
ncbi:MAG: hypothetical protein GWO38_29800, partial [Phycisphaerae bacterium]|nr:hypothetical protein [Phycisphaerae bacterium]NIX31710.1 hypothetical protein [Phycisphaerae bacterium]